MESSVSPAFWILSVVIVLSASLVVSLKNIFHCALFLILSLSSVAGIFILLNAEFLAAAQVLIYVGAVAILIIFAVMLTSNLTSNRIRQSNENRTVAFFICMIFAMANIILLANTGVWRYSDQVLPEDNIATLGKYLMTEFMLPFEIVSVLLLAAMIGAIVLARKESS